MWKGTGEDSRVVVKDLTEPYGMATDLIDTFDNQYTFEVHKSANKIDIRKAVEMVFGVRVTKGARAAIEKAGGSIED